MQAILFKKNLDLLRFYNTINTMAKKKNSFFFRLFLFCVWTCLYTFIIITVRYKYKLPYLYGEFWIDKHSQFIEGKWGIHSLDDLKLILLPIIFLLFWYICFKILLHFPFKKVFMFPIHFASSIIKRLLFIRPRLTLKRHHTEKPRALTPNFSGMKKEEFQPQNQIPVPPVSESAVQENTSNQTNSNTSSVNSSQTAQEQANEQNANQQKNQTILQEITSTSEKFGFKVFSNLTMAGHTLPLSCARDENAVLFKIVDKEGANWIIEESDDYTQSHWFSGASYMPSPCSSLLNIKQALLEKESGLKVFCVLILSKGSILDEDVIQEEFNQKGISLVCLNENMNSSLLTLEKYFTETFE